jgi:hypothetical protein
MVTVIVCRLLVLLGSIAFLPVASSAQLAAARPGLPRFSVDATLGTIGSRGPDEYLDQKTTGSGGDLLIAFRVLRSRAGSLVAAASASAFIGTRKSLLICRPDPAGGCLQPFPSFSIVAAHLGWEDRSSHVRVLVGPARVSSELADATPGWEFRVEGAAVSTRHLALIGGFRVTTAPEHHRDNSFTILAGGLGVRFRFF